MRNTLIGVSALLMAVACSGGTSDTPPGSGTQATGGSMATGVGGSDAVGGGTATGGGMATGGYGVGGSVATGGSGPGTGGVVSGTGGVAPGTGGVAPGTGGVAPGTGGFATGGIMVATGGTTMATGGTTTSTGGIQIVGNTGGTTSSTGGTDESTGGTTNTGGDDEPNPPGWTVNASGYVTSGELEGYAWTNDRDGFGEGFEDIDAGDDLCASGTIAASATWASVEVAMIGWNIAQEKGSSSTSTAELSGSSLTVTYSNAGGTPIRLQLTGSKEYCVDLSGSSSASKTETFDLSDFTVECWEGGAQSPAYSGQAIEAIALIAPGDSEDEGGTGEDRAVDMCLLGIEVE